MAADSDVDSASVLIVGGGLVGLSAAMFLALRDVSTVVVEKRPGSSIHPRAIGYTTRTIELFSAAGVELPPHAGAQSGPGRRGMPRRVRADSLAGQWHDEYPWSPAAVDQPAIEYSPSRLTAIAQDRLEPLLRDRAIELGADVRFATELINFSQSDEGVVATLRGHNGNEKRVRADYLIAADGVHSQVREELAIGRSGQGLLSVQTSILFRAPLEEYLERGIVQFEIEQPDFSAFLTTYGDGRWVLMLSDDIARDEEAQRVLVQRAIGRTDIDIDLITSGRWELAALIADEFRAGRVFLAGDAAHQLPPNRGGYGANTGIEDAHNLAWKLAATLSGRSTPELLDTYDAERRPVAWLRHEQIFARADYKARLHTPVSEVPIIDDDAMELGQLYRSTAVIGADPGLPPAMRPDQWAGQPGTRAPHLRTFASEGPGSTLDLFQRDWVLLSEEGCWRHAALCATAALGIDLTFVHMGVDVKLADTQAFLTPHGLETGGATLVRPDGYIAWRAPTLPADPARALTAALASASSAVRRAPSVDC